MLTREYHAREGQEDSLLQRGRSLRERYPGDISHRPLDMLAREHRAADRAPHLHNHRRQQPSDTIDSLDISGPVPGATYHHGGPFDPTLKERNMNKQYSPVEAVRGTNMEALRATPSEYVQDSLDRHVPLQGTAVIPPGMRDTRGRTMHYDEGADLMREEDAEGGPYRRWAHLQYRDDDLKGKAEPAFSSDQARIEQKERAQHHHHHHHHHATASPRGMVYYEMQPPSTFRDHDSGAGGKHKEGASQVHQRSDSKIAQLDPVMSETAAGLSSGSQRDNTPSKSFTQSLKKRFGNMRRKKASVDMGR
ncbi:hypothetical protein C8A05DRAFT_40202 [Staphylotrichum tortipilum]|nr:hypothetical protein C8A05DRAFT_40202 [Staphylotrichum longicolle]